MLNAIRLLAALLAAMAATASFAAAPGERRVALVVGNAAYRNTAILPNPRNDADDVATALRRVGFEVVDGRDLDKPGIDLALSRFARLARDADAAVFYYAGHGIQFQGENYLVPVDARLEDEFSLRFETTRVYDVVAALNESRGVKVLVLDACRNNPLFDRMARRSATREMTRGLARIDRAQGMLVAYATQANDVAFDGNGRNSYFTSAFVKELETPGVEVGQLFRRVAATVNRQTQGRQTPELSISLLGDFYMNRGETDIQAWARIRGNPDPAELQGFLTAYPASDLADAARARLGAIERSGGAIPPSVAEGRPLPGPSASRPADARETSSDPPSVVLRPSGPDTRLARLPDAPADERRPAPSQAALVSSIHLELQRLGCLAGKPESWSSPQSTRAIRTFARLANVEVPADPSPAFLDALQARPERVCPIACGRGEVERGGLCVAKAKPAKRVVERPAEPRPRVPASNGGRQCFSFNGSNFCQ